MGVGCSGVLPSLFRQPQRHIERNSGPNTVLFPPRHPRGLALQEGAPLQRMVARPRSHIGMKMPKASTRMPMPRNQMRMGSSVADRRLTA